MILSCKMLTCLVGGDSSLIVSLPNSKCVRERDNTWSLLFLRHLLFSLRFFFVVSAPEGEARVFTTRVPQEIGVARGVVRVAGVHLHRPQERLLRSDKVVPSQPQKNRVAVQRVGIRRFDSGRPLEELFCPAAPNNPKLITQIIQNWSHPLIDVY